jgi:son of sevenless-like protein
MSALLSALSSTALTRLHLTWAHTGRRSTLDNLLKYNDPTGGFAGYRGLIQSAEGPCLPFIGMFLTDIVHTNDQLADDFPSVSKPDITLISFSKRQRYFDIISAMLRHQRKPYNFAENDSTKMFIESHLKDAATKDQEWFWVKSQEVQQTELAHADIRKGLEAAGF